MDVISPHSAQVAPLRPLRRWLLGLRAGQVVLALVGTIVITVAVGLVGAALTEVDRAAQQASSTTSPGSAATSGASPQKEAQDYTYDSYYLLQLLLVGTIAYTSVCLLTLCLAITWLVYTASPKARARASCCGNPTPCSLYTCDMAWDIVMAVLWGIIFSLSVAFSSSAVDVYGVLNCIFTALLCCMFVATAVLCSRVRRQLRQPLPSPALPYQSPNAAGVAAAASDRKAVAGPLELVDVSRSALL